ncbi:MAG: hypothetical protein EPN82_13305, partial [Bacteroidetes bacterium]
MKTKISLFLLSALLILTNCIYTKAKDFNLKEFKEKLPELLSSSNSGLDFWITFNPNWETTEGLKLKIYISSQFTTNVTIEVPSKGYNRQQKTVPNDIVEFTLTPPLGQCYRKTDRQAPEPDAVYDRNGVHVYSDAPIICYGVSRAPYTSDSYLALPVSSLGREYVVASWPDISDNDIQYLPCYTGIVSPYDNNTVSFTMGGTDSSKTEGGQLPGKTRTYTLYKGDVLLISSAGHLSDLSGSRISSSKPVSVISSNFCAYVPENVGYCDFMMEAELPTYSWGKIYLYTPISGRLNNSIIRLFTKEAGTIIYRDGIQLAKLDSASGLKNVGWLNIRADEGAPRPIVFSSDKPIYIEQYNCGQDDDKVVSDPFMMVLTSYEQFQKEITFNTPGIRGGFGFARNYLNIVHSGTESDNLPDDLMFAKVVNGQFVWQQLDSLNLKTEKFSIPVNGKTYYNTTMLLPGDGVYKIRANAPLGVYSYGFSSYDSYGHPANVLLRDLSKNDSIAPEPSWILDCDGTIKFGYVEDMPRNNDRSNLSQIVFQHDKSENYNFSYYDFITGENAFTNWYASVIDAKKDARLVVTFSDRRGNDTTIEVDYESNYLNIKPDVDFGKLKIGDTVIKEVSGYNEQSHPISIDSLILKYNDKGFELLNQNFPLILDEGSSIMFRLRFIATK